MHPFMLSRPSLKHFLKAFIGLVLSTFFIVNVHESLEKYLAEKTTLAISQTRPEKMELPYLTLCPNFTMVKPFYEELNG